MLNSIKIILLLSLTLGMGAKFLPVTNHEHEGSDFAFSAFEKEYIANRGTIKVVGKDGLAPIQSYDSQGQISGISVKVLEEIALMSGLDFEFSLLKDDATIKEADKDIVMGVIDNSVPEAWIVTKPYLTTETVLFLNSKASNEDLHALTYGAYSDFQGLTMVNDKTAKFYHNFEDAVTAVNAGDADFGYGNQYSVSFYQVKKNLGKLYTIPLSHIDLSYSFAVDPNDAILQGIITKTLDNISEPRLNTLKMMGIADSYENYKSIVFEFVDDFATEIIIGLCLMVIAMVLLALFLRKSRNTLKFEKRRQEIFMDLSDELFFEYDTSSKSAKYVGTSLADLNRWELSDEVLATLENVLKHGVSDHCSSLIYRKENMDDTIFEMYHNNIRDSHGNTQQVIGKLEDITERVSEKVDLIRQARTDGLTGFYNAKFTKEEVERLIEAKPDNTIDVLALIDLDDFKNINDTHGHLRGNEILVAVSEVVDEVLSSKGLWGRVGGDEFLVYLQDVQDIEKLRDSMLLFAPTLKKKVGDDSISGTVGMALVTKPVAYDEVFAKADRALYYGKGQGKNFVTIFDYIEEELV